MSSTRTEHRGFILISSYLLLSVFIIYSSAMAMRTVTQGRVNARLGEQMQATGLAQGALAQLREDLHFFLTKTVYQNAYQGNAVAALAWLDDVGLQQEVPMFDLSPQDRQRDATAAAKLSIVLPTLRDPGVEYARAWIVSVAKADDPAHPGQPDPDPLATRLVTMEAEARIGHSTKRLQATYEIGLSMSDIFRYAYFVNNYGWIQVSDKNVYILGDLRSNGNFRLSGQFITIDGDLYASVNLALTDPVTGLPSTGLIDDGGYDPRQETMQRYWRVKRDWSHASLVGQARPTRRLVFPDQPAIGLTPKFLDPGLGYDADVPDPAAPDEQRFPEQPIQPMPYLGDLDLYREMAGASGSTLTHTPWTFDAQQNTWVETQTQVTISQEYNQSSPLVLIGTLAHPITLNGPIVASGDVLIKGYITGRGTIYAGRNIHVVGDIMYVNRPWWPALERDLSTGQIRNASLGHYSPDLGSVCDTGVYVPNDGSSPASRCQ